MIDISIVIPYYNESDTISNTLHLIENQTLKPKEVIFVNSSSEDRSSEIVDLWIQTKAQKSEIKYLNIISNSTTPSSSKNIGIKNSNFDWIAFMDCGLSFSTYWLEELAVQLSNNGFKPSIVSGVCRLDGFNSFDICAVAQTYGVGTNRICIPGSLVNKKVFDVTGLFLENMRASYDRAWQMSTRKKNILRVTPKINNVSYIGVNFSKSSHNLLRKMIVYSSPAIEVKGYFTPYIYISSMVFLFVSFFFFPFFGVLAFLSYFIIRGYYVPLSKSNEKLKVLNSIKILILLPYVGLLIDFGRISGYILGFHTKIFGVKSMKITNLDN
jgi:glycosyltransferase involved in cell wall biosynthesis